MMLLKYLKAVWNKHVYVYRRRPYPGKDGWWVEEWVEIRKGIFLDYIHRVIVFRIQDKVTTTRFNKPYGALELQTRYPYFVSKENFDMMYSLYSDEEIVHD